LRQAHINRLDYDQYGRREEKWAVVQRRHLMSTTPVVWARN